MLCLVFTFTRNWSAHGILSVRVCSFSTFVHFGFRTRTPVHPYVQLGGLFCDECLLLHSILFLELLLYIFFKICSFKTSCNLLCLHLQSECCSFRLTSRLFFCPREQLKLLFQSPMTDQLAPNPETLYYGDDHETQFIRYSYPTKQS